MADVASDARTSFAPGPVLALGVGAAVAVLLGTYGRVHDPTGDTALVAFFSGQIQFKAWLATLTILFAVVQVVSALRLYGRLGSPAAPPWLGDLHRLTGTLALLSSLPVAYHCLWSIGFWADPGLNRVFVHSVAGCLFYGVFAIKVLAVRSGDRLGWALPFVGGTAFAVLVLVWFTSSYWFFTSFEGDLW